MRLGFGSRLLCRVGRRSVQGYAPRILNGDAQDIYGNRRLMLGMRVVVVILRRTSTLSLTMI